MNVIIVLNYNDADNTTRYVNEIKEYKCVDRIVIVDNCSSDTSVKRLEPLSNDEKVDLVVSKKNAGYAAGNNVGVRYSVDKYGKDFGKIIISNPDIYLSEETFERVMSAFDHGYRMATGVIYNYDVSSEKKELVSNFAWRTPNTIDMFSNCFLIWYKLRRKVFNNSMYLKYEEHPEYYITTSCVPGCFFAIDVNALDRIGYFDESTFLFGEETILGWQLEKIGCKACVVNNTEVLHENSASIKKNVKGSRIKEKYMLDSNLVYMKKYPKCNAFICGLYKVFYWIGTLENKIVRLISRMRRGR